jgi:multidrug efflux pump subunit AcrA (membrane-fusion protein)
VIPPDADDESSVVLSNDGGLLLPGMFARVRITIFEQDNALVVPNDAVEKRLAEARCTS